MTPSPTGNNRYLSILHVKSIAEVVSIDHQDTVSKVEQAEGGPLFEMSGGWHSTVVSVTRPKEVMVK